MTTSSSPTVFDVAAYILDKMGEAVPTFKLQKLVYYCQAWSLVREDEALFPEEIQAWVHSPVVPILFEAHRGKYDVSSGFFKDANPSVFNEEQKETIYEVIKFYGKEDSQWLINLTHMEDPWIDARVGLDDMERGNRVITLDSMKAYYGNN